MLYLPNARSDNEFDRRVAIGLQRARTERALIFQRLLFGRRKGSPSLD